MIREIINFTKDLIEDIPDIMQWNLQPSNGIHVLIELDNKGNWINKDKDLYIFFNGKCINGDTSVDIIKYEEFAKRVGTSMNKVFDLPAKQIFSCSPFVVSFKKKSILVGSTSKIEVDKIVSLLHNYFKEARKFCINENKELCDLSEHFEEKCSKEVINYLVEKKYKNGVETKDELIIDKIKEDAFINIYLKNVSLEDYESAHNNYTKDKLFNSNKYNKVANQKIFGLSNFLNGLNAKKMFLEHKTSINNIPHRITMDDAKYLYFFESLLNRKVLPNPLPIIIDQRELKNSELVSYFNLECEAIAYSTMLKNIFEKKNINKLSNYYLINYSKGKKIQLNDVDFVPLFRFSLNPCLKIHNIFNSGIFTNNEFQVDKDIDITDIFKFERIVIKEIFNNTIVRNKGDKYVVDYFKEIDSGAIYGKDIMYLLIMKYRKSCYDFIYKSKLNAITQTMFEDIMYQSILSNIRYDNISSRFCYNNIIKKKLNIWFSLYKIFNNDLKGIDMFSKITDLITKMSAIAKGEKHIESPEEFAFSSGQIVSFLIDRSVASNKTYAMLEPYLQKAKSGQLQDAIAHTISIYKHDISTYKGAFHNISADILTYDNDVDMKPIVKYFLAGCFSECVIYKKLEDNNN